MSKLTDEFREVRVFNESEFAGHGNVYISYYPEASSHGSSWVIIRPGYKTDPEGAWYNYGHKVFLVDSPVAENKADALAKAMAWAEERYGIKEWKRTPFGSWMDAEFVKRRVKELKEQIIQQQRRIET